MRETKILLVEPQSSIATDIQKTLERWGYAAPMVIRCGEAVFEKAAEVQPDLVVIEFNREGQPDGVAALEQIRAQLDIPVLLLTACSNVRALQQAGAGVCFGVVCKPFQQTELLIAVEIALQRHKREQELKQRAEGYRAAAAVAERQIARLAALNQASQKLAASLEPSQMVERLLRAAVQLTGAAGGMVWLWDKGRPGELVCQGALLDGRYTAPCDLHLSPGQSVAGQLARAVHSAGEESARSALVTAAQMDPHILASIEEQLGVRIDSALSVPLQAGDHLHGVLQVIRKEGSAPGFDAPDRFLAETLATSAATSIDNAQLRDALQHHVLALEGHSQDPDGSFSATAHELKGALARMIGFAELLEEEYESLTVRQVRRCLERIVRNGCEMADLVNELLDQCGGANDRTTEGEN